MNGKDHSIASGIIVASSRTGTSTTDRARKLWLAAMAISGVFGIASGVVGLVLSFLAAEGVVDASRSVRLAVPALIVASLALMMLSAHAMDRLHAIKVKG